MNWVKSHKLIVVLLIIIAFLLFRGNYSPLTLNRTISTEYYVPSLAYPQAVDMEMGIGKSSSLAEPQIVNTSSRMVVQTSNLSLLVKDVKETGDKILNFAKTNGGYMINASYSRPTESPFGNITIRVPAKSLDKTLTYFKELAIKVTNENLVGTDITDEYTDIEAQLATLNKTKTKFEEILDKATEVQDILTVQRELINLQSQIDSLIGQQKAMEKNAELTKIIVYLSTDELALPYTPDTVFRPDVTFKLAVRSVLNHLKIGAEALIWIAVYSPLFAILILIYIFIKRWKKRRNITSN